MMMILSFDKFLHSVRRASRKTVWTLCVALLGGFALSGCTTNSVVANAAKAAFEDRLAEEQIVDAKIKTSMLKNNVELDKMLALDLSIDVWKTRVMLTGVISNPAQRDKVVAMARQDKRISKLYDDIQIVTADAQNERREWREKAEDGADAVAEAADDFWIETKISAQLIAAEGVSSVNYRWRCVMNTVYIIGEAQTTKEFNTVISTIKSIEGVKAVRNYIQVRGS